jgi:NADPH:quinone reductase-like Zn-dependent oxidoreductase
MKAAVCTQYGPPEVLQIQTLERPVPKAGEILIKIHAAAVNSGDCRLRRADPAAVRLFLGFSRPRKKVLGDAFSGEVVETGAQVTRFKTGDHLFGTTGLRLGAFAEYVCLPAEGIALVLKPANISHEWAAATPFGYNTALHFWEKAGLKSGQKVLVYGASGSVGSAAVQLAKHLGAEVTAVCSAANAALVQSLGADRVIDYATTDFAAEGAVYDIVFETVNKTSVKTCLSAVKPGGTLILGSAMLTETLQGVWAGLTSGKKVISGMAADTQARLDKLQGLLQSDAIQPAIDKVFPFEEIVEAHRLVDSGRKRGNVVLRFKP